MCSIRDTVRTWAHDSKQLQLLSSPPAHQDRAACFFPSPRGLVFLLSPFPSGSALHIPFLQKTKQNKKSKTKTKKVSKKKKKKGISSTKVSDCSQVLQPRPFSKTRSGLSRPHYGSTGLNCIMCITGEVFSSIYSLISFI